MFECLDERMNTVVEHSCFYTLHLHFEARRVFCVEAPHAASARWSCGPATAACAAAGSFPVEHTTQVKDIQMLFIAADLQSQRSSLRF